MKLSSVTQKGQVTIPVEFREVLNLKQGDQVAFELRDHEVVLVKHTRPVEELFGMFSVPFPVTDQDIKKAIIRGACRGHRARH